MWLGRCTHFRGRNRSRVSCSLVGTFPLTFPPPLFPQAHIKSALIGASVTVPITDGKLAMGAWQGVWLMEFRNSKHTRNVVATIQGEKM